MRFINFTKIKSWILAHKIISAILILIIAFGGYKVVKSFGNTAGTTRYITATAKKADIASTVSGSGQVSASSQVDITSEVTGDVTKVVGTLGQQIKKGGVIAYIDSADASRAVQNAQLSLENSKISYDKALKQSQDQADTSSVSDLKKAYDDGYTAISDTFIDIPDIISGVNDILYDPTHSPYLGDIQVQSSAGSTAINYKYDAGKTFDQARKDFDTDFVTYKSLDPNINQEKIVALLKETYDTTKKLSTSLTGVYNTIDYIKARMTTDNVPAQIATDKTALNSYITKLNNHLTSISNAENDIEDAKDSAITSTLDLKSAELAVNEAQAKLKDAQTDLYNHTIVSPFDGIIAKVDVENADKIGNGGAIATVITNQEIAEVSLNEVDISKVKVGQSADITFDAIDGLTVKGEVTEVDLLGTVSQGVVSYTVKIAFDSNDDRIKTGMSLSASIVNESKQGVITVPNAAVKSQGNMTYVESDQNGVIKRIPIKVGISNDEYTEVISGLSEGDSYVARTVTTTGTTAGSAAAAPSLFGGGNRAAAGGAARTGGGANVRFQAR